MIVFDASEFNDRFGFLFNRKLIEENSQLGDIDWDKFLKYLYMVAATKISPEEDTAVLLSYFTGNYIFFLVYLSELSRIQRRRKIYNRWKDRSEVYLLFLLGKTF